MRTRKTPNIMVFPASTLPHTYVAIKIMVCFQNGLVGSPCSPRDSQESSPHHSSKASILRHSAFFTIQLLHPYMTTGKTIALTRRTFVGKVMSVLFNMLSAAAKSLQSCLTLCDPRDSSPPGSPVPGILQVRTLEWVVIAFSI